MGIYNRQEPPPPHLNHGTPPQLSPAPCRLRRLSSIPSRPCCCPSSSSSSSTCSSCCKKEEASSRGTCSRSGSGRSSSCSSTCSRLHLSTCRSCSCCSSTCCCSSCSSTCSSGGCSNGSSCVCIFDLISFQGFHSFLLMCFINKQTNESFLQHARISKAF